MTTSEKLRDMLRRGEFITAPGAFDAISAKIIERTGFRAVYLSGAGLSNSAGMHDIGLLTMTEFSAAARLVVRAVNIPVIADIDTGFGGIPNVARAVAEFRDAGVAAVQIEDQEFPKRCGHLPGKTLVPSAEMVEKLEAAKSAAGNMLVIARTDARSVTGLPDALERAAAYARAGADIIFPEALESEEEFKIFRQHISVPLLANMTEFGKTPFITAASFNEIGINMAIFPMTGFRVMIKALEDAMGILYQEGTQQNLLNRMLTRQQLYTLLNGGDGGGDGAPADRRG